MTEIASTPITKEQIQNLRIPFKDVLPSGYIKKLIERTGYSENWIIKVLSGSENPNEEIIRAAFELIAEQDDRRDDFQRQFVWEG